jgi:hypothetical protein
MAAYLQAWPQSKEAAHPNMRSESSCQIFTYDFLSSMMAITHSNEK